MKFITYTLLTISDAFSVHLNTQIETWGNCFP